VEIHDWIAIHQLLARMAPAYDEGDADALADCYIADGILDGTGFTARGRQELKARVTETFTGRPRHRHHNTNVLIEIDPDDPERARARSCWLYTLATGELNAVASTGTYEDELVKDDGVWRIKRRTVRRDDTRE
jgi:uncharacterized protein (TIGR02246 family)